MNTIGLHVGRLAELGVCFTFAALSGAPALIATLVGFTLGRTLELGQHR